MVCRSQHGTSRPFAHNGAARENTFMLVLECHVGRHQSTIAQDLWCSSAHLA